MTKREELIDKLKDRGDAGAFGLTIATAIEVVNEVMKPVVVPQYVADHIEISHKCYRSMQEAMGPSDSTRVNNWIFSNSDDFARAYLDGDYEVEKEQKYLVKVKGIGKEGYRYLNWYANDKKMALSAIWQIKTVKTHFTKSWLAENWPEYKTYDEACLLEFVEVDE